MNENSYQIGKNFEESVYELFSTELGNNSLWLNKDRSEIYLNKLYYSRDRGSEIEFDITIESYAPNSDYWSTITIIECKNYSSKVPVDDIEEFFSKIQQIAPAKSKGIVVSPNGFQSGAIKFAESKGIALIRYINKESFKWVLYRTPTSLVKLGESEKYSDIIKDGLTKESFENEQIDFFGYVNGIYTYSIYELIKNLFNDLSTEDVKSLCVEKEDSNYVPFIDKFEIENLSNDILTKSNYTGSAIDFYSIFGNENNLSLEEVEKIGIDHLGFEIIGQINFDENIIRVSKSDNINNERKRFTIAHELGHFFLNHNKYLKKEFYSEIDLEHQLNQEYISEIKRLEWQANYFAATLLMPKKRVINYFKKEIKRLSLINKGFGPLYVDDQSCNLDSYFKVTNSLKRIFQVSREAIEIRLKELNLLNDQRSQFKKIPKRIDNIL